MKTRIVHPQTSRLLLVTGLTPRSPLGFVELGPLLLPCALGRSGRSIGKREGDGATPVGSFRLREAFYRADRLRRPRTRLPITPLRTDDGWCDDPADRNYNRRVRHPYPASAERLWRTDHLYDLVVVVGYNDCPRVPGRGSAIFMHVAHDDLAPTAGCVALRLAHLVQLIESVSDETRLRILP